MAVGPAGADASAGVAVIGLFRKGTWQVVPSGGCAANHPLIVAAMEEVQGALDKLRGVVLPFHHNARASWNDDSSALRYIELTVERASNRVQLVLVWNGERGSRELEQLVDVLWPRGAAQGPGRVLWHSIWVHWRDADPALLRAIHSKRSDAWEQVRPAAGEADPDGGVVVEALDGLPFAFGPASFQQSNLGVFEQILRDMKSALRERAPSALSGDRGPPRPLQLLELCGGVGVIGLSLAHAVSAWERSPGVSLLSTDLNSNCERLFSQNARRLFPELDAAGQEAGVSVRFRAVSAQDALCPPGTPDADEGLAAAADVLILDPPRRGLARNMHRLGLRGGLDEAAAIRASPARLVVYMSCGHESFMADADRLTGADPEASGAGWGPPFRLERLSCYDMFPFTPHVETLGIFARSAVGDGRRPATAERSGTRPRARPRPRAAASKAAAARRAPKLQCQFLVGIEDAGFRAAGRLLGRAGQHMKLIATRSKAKLRLRGRGSGFREGPEQKESADPLMLCVSAPDPLSYDEACRLVRELLQDVHEQYRKFCSDEGRPAPQLRIDLNEGPRAGT